MPEKIINDGICSRASPAMHWHAAFARPFISLPFFKSLPPPKKKIQYLRPNVPLNSSQVLIPLPLRLLLQSAFPRRDKRTGIFGGRRVILIFVFLFVSFLEIRTTPRVHHHNHVSVGLAHHSPVPHCNSQAIYGTVLLCTTHPAPPRCNID
jgi:hypothetical protein